MAVVQEAYIHGVSTRAVDDLVRAMGLTGTSKSQVARALGLAGLLTSGLLTWQDDPREDARPFQMGLAARNEVTAALLARDGFGAPDRVFDSGHNVLSAYGDSPVPDRLTQGLGTTWEGLTQLAIKPYPCVSFLHPALDALDRVRALDAAARGLAEASDVSKLAALLALAPELPKRQSS